MTGGDAGGWGSGFPSRRANSVASRAVTSCLAYSFRASMPVLSEGGGFDASGGTFLLRVTLTAQGVLVSMLDTCALGAAVMCLRYRGCPLPLDPSHMEGTTGLYRHLVSSPEHTTGGGAGVGEFEGVWDPKDESCSMCRKDGGGSELSERPILVREDAVRVRCCLLGLRVGLMLLLNREEEDWAGRGGAVLAEAS